jgi:predicted RNase H-like HicB family nuclease
MDSTAVIDAVTIPITVDFLEEDQVYQVSCLWLPGCHAWGETLDEAVRAIPGNIRAMIAARRVKGASIPPQFSHLGGDQPFNLRFVTQ